MNERGTFRTQMRLLFVFFSACAAALCVPTSNAVERNPSFNGHEYIELEKWADQNRFRFNFSRKEGDDEFHVSSRTNKIVFRPKSQRIDLNGIGMFLAFPLVMHQGAPFVARKDVDCSLEPMLFPGKNKLKTAVKTVAISAGHGGKDSGYQVAGQLEKKYTLLLAQEVKQCLAKAGLKPVLIRSSDKLVDHEEKLKLAKRAKADVFLELHYNSAGSANKEPRGVEVYCLTPAGANSTNGGSDQYGSDLPGNRQDAKNSLLAYHVQQSLVSDVGLADRGVRRARFAVLRESEMPAILVESGFMSNPDEMRNIQDAKRRRQTAQAIADGVLTYKRLLER